jgi:hypothetical protein
MVSTEEKTGWLKIENHVEGSNYAFVSIDGVAGVFRKTSPPVKDEAPFKYTKTYFIDPETRERKTRTETAGPCDCLVLDKKWHFVEFKTDAKTSDVNQANENRTKGELQLARTLTFFREKAIERNLNFPSDSICVLVTIPSFPRVKAKLLNRAVKFSKAFQVQLIETQSDKTYLLT